MNKEDLILKGIKIILEGDYFVGAEEWIKEYDEIYKVNEEPCCEMPKEKEKEKFLTRE